MFQGEVSPVSSRIVLESCVMLGLLHRLENWILTDSLLEELEAFQGKVVKQVLKWSWHHSNTAAITALNVSTMRCRILVKFFLWRILGSDLNSLSG